MEPVPGIAVQRLNRRHRDDIARHLLQLPTEDRRLRFGHQIRDAAVSAYLAGIDFARDRVFGIQIADQFALVDSLLKQQYLWLAAPRSEPVAFQDVVARPFGREP